MNYCIARLDSFGQFANGVEVNHFAVPRQINALGSNQADDFVPKVGQNRCDIAADKAGYSGDGNSGHFGPFGLRVILF